MDNFNQQPNPLAQQPVQYSQPQAYSQSFQYQQSQPYQQPAQPQQPQPPHKKNGGCAKGCLSFLLVVILIIGVIVGVVLGVMSYTKNKEKEALKQELNQSVPHWDMQPEVDAYLESIKEEESDIPGWTKGDKIAKGLSPEFGSDSDGDGLTDFEEITVYSTDPLNPSTAEDGISDGLKIINDLDPHTKYNPKDVAGTVMSMYPSITLENVEDNPLAFVSDVAGYTYQGTPVRKAYSINRYDGKITIDFSSFITGSDYFIFRRDDTAGSTYQILEDNAGVVTFDTQGQSCTVGCVPLPRAKFNSSKISDTLTSDGTWVIVYPITGLYGKMQVHVVEEDLFGLKPDRSQEMLEYFSYADSRVATQVEITHDRVSPAVFMGISWLCNLVKSDALVDMALSQEPFENTEQNRSLFKEILSYFVMVSEMDPSGWMKLYLDQYKPKEDPDSDPDQEEKPEEKPSEYITTFDFSRDVLPFSNLTTYVSPGGNCAGFALITAETFLGNYPEPATSYYSSTDEITYSYDISQNPECDTFFNKGLNDFKNKTYWKDTYPDGLLDPTSISKDDKAFLDFLGYKWAYWNEVDSNIRWYNSEVPWSKFETVLEYLRTHNEVLVLGMGSGGSAHAINIYGAEQDPDDPNVWYLLVYDNNFPDNYFKEYRMDNRVKIVKKTPWFGEPYFEFDYRPFKDIDPDFGYSSHIFWGFSSLPAGVATAGQIHMFVVTNTEGTVLAN